METENYYDDFISCSRMQAIQDSRLTTQPKPALLPNHPNRIFDPDPFLQNGLVQPAHWEILGIQSLVAPSATGPLTVNSILIDVHGASRSLILEEKNKKMTLKRQGTDKGDRSMENIDLAYGVYFGPESPNNRGNIITDIAWKDRQGAYMYATIVALKKVTKILNPQVKAHLYTDIKNPSSRQVKYAFRLLEEAREKIKLVVIRADTKILGYSLNKNIYNWLKRGFHTCKGINRPSEPLLREIHELMVELEEKGVSVQFWGVNRYDTNDVEDITSDLLDESAARREEAEAREEDTLRGEVKLEDEE